MTAAAGARNAAPRSQRVARGGSQKSRLAAGEGDASGRRGLDRKLPHPFAGALSGCARSILQASGKVVGRPVTTWQAVTRQKILKDPSTPQKPSARRNEKRHSRRRRPVRVRVPRADAGRRGRPKGGKG